MISISRSSYGEQTTSIFPCPTVVKHKNIFLFLLTHMTILTLMILAVSWTSVTYERFDVGSQRLKLEVNTEPWPCHSVILDEAMGTVKLPKIFKQMLRRNPVFRGPERKSNRIYRPSSCPMLLEPEETPTGRTFWLISFV